MSVKVCFQVSVIIVLSHLWHLSVCYYLPQINLGEVDLSKNPSCEKEMQSHLTKCTVEYRSRVEKAMKQSHFNVSSDLVRRATCCGIWNARRCASRGARISKSCGIVEARAFEKLPIEGDIIWIMDKQCDGLYFSSHQCSNGLTLSLCNQSCIIFILFVIISHLMKS